MMGNVELAPEVDVSALEPLLSQNVVSELLDTYMSTLTVSRPGLQSQKFPWWLSVRQWDVWLTLLSGQALSVGLSTFICN
jgi:hypothetical protein